MTRSSQRLSTSSSWWLENSTGTSVDTSSRSSEIIASTASGSRPLKGSSSTSAAGRCISAHAIWTRCWLPSDSFSNASPRPLAQPEPLEQLVGPGAGAATSWPWSRPK